MRRGLRIAALGAALAAAAPAAAQEPTRLACWPTASVLAWLEESGEAPRASGLTARGHVMQLFVAPDGAWTVVLLLATGYACPILDGTALELLQPAAPGAAS